MFEPDMYGLCRVCLNDSRFYSHVFEELLREGYLYEVLNDVCQLDVKVDDGLPEFVCYECYEKLSKFESFKRQSHEGNATLQRMKSDLENVQVKVEPDLYGAESIREETMEMDAVGFQEEIVVKQEIEDPLFFEEDERDEWHGLDLQHVIKTEDGTTDDGGFSAVQTEVYLMPVKTEDDDSIPADRDPLEVDVNAEPEDPMHSDEDASDSSGEWYLKVSKSSVYSEGSGDATDSEKEQYGMQVNAVQILEGKKRFCNGSMTHNMATNDESDITSEGTSSVDQVRTTLPNVNHDRPVSNDNKRHTVKRGRMEASTSKIVTSKSNKRKRGHGELKDVDKCDASANVNVTCVYAKRVVSGKSKNVENRKKEETDLIGKCSGECRSLKCDDCGEECVSESDFVDHTKLHCGLSDNGSKLEDGVMVAGRKLHSRNDEDVRSHQKRSYDCSFCSTTEKCQSMTNEKFDAGKLFKCDLCEKSFSQTSNLRRHLMIHSGEKRFKCNSCDKEFSQLCNLQKHEKLHVREMPFKCSFCSEGFHRVSLLRNHEGMHTGQKPYKCGSCDKAFSHGSLLKRHEMVHTGERPFKCGSCEKAFSRCSNLQKHEMEHVGEKRLQCGSCNKMFSHISTLVEHERMHTREKHFKCNFCDKEFYRASHLKEHEMVHTGERPFQCGSCDKAFSQLSKLRRHEMVHSGEKPLKCNWCYKSFSDSSNLSRHIRVHTGEKPYSCIACDKTFSNRSNLKVHLLLHTGERPYKCGSCNKTFSHPSNLRRHESVHTDGMPYKCKLCAAEYMDSSDLKTHEILHTVEINV